MKKLLFAVALVAFSSNVYAADLASSLDKMNSKVVSAQEKVDAQKAKIQAKKDALTAKVESKTAEQNSAKDAKAAEVQEKANTLKTNLGNLKKSLSVTE